MADHVKVFSVPKNRILEEFLMDNYASKADEFKDEEARHNEIKRVLSTLGVDSRDEINEILIGDIIALAAEGNIKESDGKKHDKKKNTRVFSVSGDHFEVGLTKIDTYQLTQRSGLNAIVIINREKEKGQKKDSYDLLEYRDGNLLFIIAGGAGESRIENIGEMAKGINISIPAHHQMTYRERKDLEKEAAENLQEIYEESKKSKNKKN